MWDVMKHSKGWPKANRTVPINMDCEDKSEEALGQCWREIDILMEVSN